MHSHHRQHGLVAPTRTLPIWRIGASGRRGAPAAAANLARWRLDIELRCTPVKAVTPIARRPLKIWREQGPAHPAGMVRSAAYSEHRPEIVGSDALANFSTVLDAFFDRFAEVKSNKDARIRVLGGRLREAGVRA